MADIYTKLVELVERDFSGYGNRIIGSEEAYRSAVLVPFVNVDGVESVLFEKRSPDIRQGGEICFPGGRVDDEDVSVLETVLRETVEETGAERKDLEVHESAGYLLTRSGALIEVFLGRMHIPDISLLKFNPDEVEKLFTVPVSFFLTNKPDEYKFRTTFEPWYEDKDGKRVELFPSRELGLPERYWNAWSVYNNKFFVYHYENEVIWGITARIMYTVSKLIHKIED